MGQHVQSLPVPFDLSGDVLILQDHALSSTLTPFCNHPEKKKKSKRTLPTIFMQHCSVFSPFLCASVKIHLKILP